MKFDFHPLASSELNEAVDYYDDLQEGLGLQFLDEIYITIERIIQFPTGWAKITRFCRRCLVHRFPYGIIYQINEKNKKIFIIAVMQLNRKPNYWKNRVNEF